MDKYVQLKKNIQLIVGKDTVLEKMKLITCKIKSIENDTCTVEISKDFSVSEVKLKSTANNQDNFLIIPKVGSFVTVISFDGTLDNLYVLKTDVAEKIIYNENGLSLEIDSTAGKIKIQNENSSLFDVMQDLVDLLKKIKVYTNTGPSGNLLPDSILAIENFENRFKQLLK